ncbi:MAG: CBS domain-containing protein [Nitrospinae bacterium]|nr:CBS domain-containing protein [Nitrospinota bacterium]
MDEIRYYMEETILTIDSLATAKEAAEMMHENSVSSLLVDQGGKYSGFLTDTDLTRKLVAKNLNPEETTVSIIASESIISLDANLTMTEAYDCMKEKNIRHLVITDKDNVCGVLSIKDFANFYHNKHSKDCDEQDAIEYFMKNSIVNIESYETISAAAKKMAYKKVGALLVTEMGKAKGIFTESSMAKDVVAKGINTTEGKISAVLNPKLITIEKTHPMSEAYQLMRNNNVRHIFVSFSKKIIGMLSIKDFANYYNFKFCKQIKDEDRVKQYMQENLETIRETHTILEAAAIMKEKEIGSLLVQDSEKVTGIVTEVEFTRNVLGNNLDPSKTTVSQVMRPPCKLDESRPMDEALALMHKNDVKYIAITRNAKVIGIISLKDLTIYYKNKFIISNDLPGYD